MNEPIYKTALLVIDVQEGLDNPALGKRNNPDAESNIARLISHWRKHDAPVVHVKHNSTEENSALRPELPGNAIKDCATPRDSEALFEKTVNSAFIGTDLERHLHASGISDLVIVGLTTDHCVSTCVRMAANLGFNVRLVGNATATFERIGHNGKYYSADEMHEINLASLNGEFCTVVTSAEAQSQLS
ncbi:MAG: cysteine hydrolase family protein [Pseudomonadota bacterium]